MLLPEARLDILIDALREMLAADRRAVLARLGAEERRRVRARLAALASGPVEPASPYSADIAARLEARDTGLTVAGRRALDAFLMPAGKGAARPEPGRGASLAQAMGGLLRPRGKLP